MNLLNRILRRNRVIWVLPLALLLCPATVQADTKRREEQKLEDELNKSRQELAQYQRQLEDLRVKRWQDKRNAVAAQEAFSNTWNDLKADIDRLAQMRNQKQEMVLRLQSQESEKQAFIDEQENRLKQFGLQTRDKLGELEKEWELGFPYNSMERMGEAGAFKKWMEKGDAASPPALERLFALAHKDFVAGETREIVRDKLAVRGLASAQASPGAAARLDPKTQARLVAGYRIRIGQVYQAFVSTESEDVAVLGKTGRLDAKAWEWIEELPPDVRDQIRTAVRKLAAGDSSSMALLPMDVLLTKATGEGFTTKAQNTWWKSFMAQVEAGGWVMYPIFALGFVGLLIILEKVVVFLRRDQNAVRLSGRVQRLVEEGRIEEARALCRGQKGSVSKVLLAILEHADDSREEAESAAHEVLLHESPALEKRVSTMNILAAAAPLVGLLGTVTGMVRLFEVITVHGTGNPKLMAGGISEALIATQWGLGTAIPLLLAYNWLDTWSGGIIANMEKYAARLVNTLFSRTRLARLRKEEAVA